MHLQPNHYNPVIPTSYNYPQDYHQDYHQPIPSPPYQASYYPTGRTDASIARIGTVAANPYELHDPQPQSSTLGVNPYIK